MITMKDFFEVTRYQITSGGRYMWECYGPDAYNIESWSGDTDGWAVDMVFDRKHQTVYQVGVYDFEKDRAVRWINPEYVDAHLAEAIRREISSRIKESALVKRTKLNIDPPVWGSVS